MIRSLTGEIANITEQSVTVVIQGIGYLVATPHTTDFAIGDIVTFHTHLAVRENALDLYGFASEAELDIFELLLSVPKIGPKSGLQILTQATPSLLLTAIHKNDPAHLHKLSGIGKKTCENVVRALEGKAENIALAGRVDSEHSSLSNAQTDAIDALVALGYDLSTARDTIMALKEDGATANGLVAKALKNI